MADCLLPMRKLGEVLSIIESGSRPSGGADADTFGIPSLGGENIRRDGSLDLNTVRKIPSDYFHSMRTGHLEPFDVLVNKDGAQTGKVGQYCGEFPKAAINEHVYLLRGDEQIRQDYLFRALQFEETKRAIGSFITGSAQPGLNLNFLKVPIPLPSLDEQRKIAMVLDDFDKAIQSIECVIVKYEGIRVGMRSSLFADLSDRNTNYKPILCMLETEFSGEWGEDYRKAGLRECRVLRSTDLGREGIDYSKPACRYMPELKIIAKRLRTRDIILESSGGGPGVPVGRVARFNPSDRKVAYLASNFFRTLRPNTDIDSNYLYYALNRLYDSPEIWHVQQQTTGIINLKVADYLQFSIPVPSLVNQQRIAGILDDIGETIGTNRRQLEKLQQLRSGVADDLLYGRVRTMAT